MIKTRLEQELSGMLGEYWIKHANNEIAKVKAEYERGEITIDENGVARNCIGRILMSDMVELCIHAGVPFNAEATVKARDIEVTKEIKEYKKAMKNHVPSEEEMHEMRAAFGAGAEVVDVLSGKTYKL